MAATPSDAENPATLRRLRAELADLERYAATAPPHAAGPLSEQLAARRAALERALATQPGGSDPAPTPRPTPPSETR